MVYKSSGKPKIHKIYGTFFEHICVFVDILKFGEVVISLYHEIVKFEIVEDKSCFVDAF